MLRFEHAEPDERRDEYDAWDRDPAERHGAPLANDRIDPERRRASLLPKPPDARRNSDEHIDVRHLWPSIARSALGASDVRMHGSSVVVGPS